MILPANLPMLGDPMEMAGKPYRQFLVERWCKSDKYISGDPSKTSGLQPPLILWVEPNPQDAPCEGQVSYRVATSIIRCVVCGCQGSFLE